MQIGEAFTGSDESDGIADNGLGLWEITSQPLADGNWTITADVEDQAGNIELLATVNITIDSQGPQRPTIDLVNLGDTGWSEFDNVTIGDLTTANLGPGIVQFRITGDVGTTITLKDGNTEIQGLAGVTPAAPLVIPASGQLIVTVDFNQLAAAPPAGSGFAAQGPHPMSVESFDLAGNFTQSEELLVEIDFTPPAANAPILVVVQRHAACGRRDHLDQQPGVPRDGRGQCRGAPVCGRSGDGRQHFAGRLGRGGQ